MFYTVRTYRRHSFNIFDSMIQPSSSCSSYRSWSFFPQDIHRGHPSVSQNLGHWRARLVRSRPNNRSPTLHRHLVQINPRYKNMEDALDLTQISKDVFVNANPPWHPGHGARGAFGGVLIAQSLLAASLTVPEPAFALSIRCTFILSGDCEVPFTYAVSRLSDMNELHVRQVRAQQEGRTIFVAAARFQTPLKSTMDKPLAKQVSIPDTDVDSLPATTGGNDAGCPYICTRVQGPDRSIPDLPHQRQTSQWIKTRYPMLNADPKLHAAAMAYMSDNYFICTVPRIHDLQDEYDPDAQWDRPLRDRTGPKVQMMLSLDHCIYFHVPPAHYRADDWSFVQMESPWSGYERALVLQRIYTRDGLQIATCTQEVSLFFIHPVHSFSFYFRTQALTIQGMVRTQQAESKI